MLPRGSRRSLTFLLLSLTMFVFLGTSTAPAFAAVLQLEQAQPIDLKFDQPTSAFEIYRAVGEAFSLDIVFDPKLKDRKLGISLTSIDKWQALEALMLANGHFYKVLEGGRILIADDNPSNRRLYEEHILRTVPLQHAAARDVATLIRAANIGHVAIDGELNSLLLRGTAAQMAISEQIINAHDKPRAEVTVDVELLAIDGETLARLTTSGGDGTARLSAAEIAELRRSAAYRSLARPRIGIVSGKRGSFTFREELASEKGPRAAGKRRAAAAQTAVEPREVSLEMSIRPTVHPQNGDITLDFELALATGAPRLANLERQLASSVRLADGETHLLNGWLLADEFGLPRLRHLSVYAGDDSHGEIVLALTPRIVRQPQYESADLGLVWISRATRLSFREGSPDDPAARELIRQRLRKRLREIQTAKE